MELGDAHETMSVLLQEHAKLQQTCERLEAEAAASQKLTRVRICESVFNLCACAWQQFTYSLGRVAKSALSALAQLLEM